jgi:hypothetical protein
MDYVAMSVLTPAATAGGAEAPAVHLVVGHGVRGKAHLLDEIAHWVVVAKGGLVVDSEQHGGILVKWRVIVWLLLLRTCGGKGTKDEIGAKRLQQRSEI